MSVIYVNQSRGNGGFGLETKERFVWVGGIEAANAVLQFTVSAAREVRVLSFVPFNLKTHFKEEILEVTQDIRLASLLGKLAGWSAVMEEFEWMFDDATFPGTLVAVREI